MTHYPAPPSAEELGLPSFTSLRKPKKFRFQLLANWICAHFNPCRVADVGGGKGLLGHLLDKDGFQSTIIDPISQPLPNKYKDLGSGKQIKIQNQQVKRLTEPYSVLVGLQFDLLVALHAHGVNLQIIDTIKQSGKSCILLPCCVIGENVPVNEDWFSYLVGYAKQQGLRVEFFHLNFKGQNVGFFVRGDAISAHAEGAMSWASDLLLFP